MAKTPRRDPIETEEIALVDQDRGREAPPVLPVEPPRGKGNPDQVTAVLMDPDLLIEIAVLRLDLREFVIGYGGEWYEQNSPRADGAWIYQQQAK